MQSLHYLGFNGDVQWQLFNIFFQMNFTSSVLLFPLGQEAKNPMDFLRQTFIWMAELPR
jgi:hypothetical protein